MWSVPVLVLRELMCRSSGKLGLGDSQTDVEKPTKVSVPEKITSVACGSNHTLIVGGMNADTWLF